MGILEDMRDMFRNPTGFSWNSTEWFRLFKNVGLQSGPSEIDWRAPQTFVPFEITSVRPRGPSETEKPEISLADQFTWGSVVCAAVFIVVFVCVMSSWWFHKRRQNLQREHHEHLRRRREEALAPFQIDNSVRTAPDSTQRPPSYFEVVGSNYELPPSYVEAVINKTENYSYYNTAIVIDEPPPFYEEQKPVEQARSGAGCQQSDVNITTCSPDAVTIVTEHSNTVNNATCSPDAVTIATDHSNTSSNV